KLSIEFADVRRLPVADLMEKAIKTAKKSGADGANAALIVACMMYLAGSAAQVGIPAGNRKLGATARMLAGVDRSGVAAIPTAKMNNKISAFPAVQAVYQAMVEGRLCSIKGSNVPVNVGGGPLYGHSALGEDNVWPEMAVNGARIGVEAMLKAFDGAAMVPHPFTAAVLGSAPILEIIHPDAEVPEGEGVYGRTTSVYLVGKAAVKAAGLPETLHMKVTGEEYETAKLVGDVALILKDIGAPSVIGMMAFDEIFACFEEGIAGFSGGPVNAPLGHVGGYAVVAMKALIANNGDVEKTMAEFVAEKKQTSFDPEVALLSINTICRKANTLYAGPVTNLLIEATDPARANAIHRRVLASMDALNNGKELKDVVAAMDQEKIDTVCKNAGTIFTGMMGAPVSIKVRKIAGAARRTTKLAAKYWSFDADIDMDVTVGDETFVMNGLAHEILPKLCRCEAYEELRGVMPLAAAVMDELALNACCNLNIVIPAATAAAMGLMDAKDAAAEAEAAAFLSRSIPGGKMHAIAVAKIAKAIVDYK
ncbi:MAG: hypothetical protein ACI4D7_06430, partial [Lachnospiraceae bacterium]